SMPTEARITAPAATSRRPTVSPTNSQPSSTATAGLTYAYVETRTLEAPLLSSQPYAVKATIEPKTTRKANAPSDPAEIAEGWTRPTSPIAAPATASSTAAASICIEADRNGAWGSGATRAYAEPAAQANAATRITAAPTGSMCALGPTSSATPNRPVAIPAIPPSESRTPKTVRSRSAANSGTEATRSAVRPDATRCSAQATPPVSTKRSSPPTIAAAVHSRRPGRAARTSPRHSDQP